MKNTKVTVVMFHYVRRLAASRYPKIKGLETDRFLEQILFINKHYNVITMESLVDAFYSGAELPPKAALLTFDDGYVDHFTEAFPILDSLGVQGTFSIPVKPVIERKVLNVNKIHYILASEHDEARLVRELFSEISRYRDDFNLLPEQAYRHKYESGSAHDLAEVLLFKRMLQYALPETVASEILDTLLGLFVKIPEEVLANELYLTLQQIQLMKSRGMHIAAHSVSHPWMGKLCEELQEKEIIGSKHFLEGLGGNRDYLTMFYPYGSFNEYTEEACSRHGFKLGFTDTSINDVLDINRHGKYALPRIDTIDLPMDRLAAPNDWYAKA